MVIILNRIPQSRLSGVSWVLTLTALLAGLSLARPVMALGADAGQEHGPDPVDMTKLVFVGEDVKVLTVASRRQEGAFQSPAVADVLTAADLRESGVQTVGQALAMMPGFYMAQREYGVQPYLRGIPDSVLFMYDTVPLGSELSKSVNPLGHDFAVTALKRIEVVRGPGSVLWGPDAFAGLVNLVPMTGEDLDGLETGVTAGGPHQQHGVYGNYGHDAGEWDAFVSVNAQSGPEGGESINFVHFWNDDAPVPLANRYGQEETASAKYLEVTANASVGDWLRWTARLSDFNRPYAVSLMDGKTWQEYHEFAQNFVKMEMKKELDRRNALRFTGYYRWLDIDYRLVDQSLGHSERGTYAELLYDRSALVGKSQFTGGLSYRGDDVKNVPVWDSFLPDFFDDANDAFLPQASFHNSQAQLLSVFGQYTHHLDDWTFLLGARQDHSDAYQDQTSVDFGANWAFRPLWILKALYGTSYRAPFASQLAEGANRQPESINNYTLQLGWEPRPHTGLTLGWFKNRVENHVKDDLYYGLSSPNSQTLSGLELEGRLSPTNTLRLEANLTLLTKKGPGEAYRFNDYSTIGDDGVVHEHFVEISNPYDAGPTEMANVVGRWQPRESLVFFGRLGYFAARQWIDPASGDRFEYAGQWSLDSAMTYRNMGHSGLDLVVSVVNLADARQQTPGQYSALSGQARQATVQLRKLW